MNRKSRILVVLVALGLVPATASPVALAGSPLLSGYGGPGTGEQAVIGSTLIGGAGGSGSGGSSGSTGSGGSGSANSTTAGGGSGSTAPGTTSAVTGGSSAGGSSGGAPGKGASGGATRGSGRHDTGSTSNRGAAGNKGVQIHAFVYPTALRSASVDPPTLGISGSDWLLFGLVIATLALVAVATVRLSRLQRQL